MPAADRLIRRRASRALQQGEGPLARLHMEFLLGTSSQALSVEQQAEQHLYETFKRAELRWRPWLISHTAVEGWNRPSVRQAVSGGALFQFMHMSAYEGLLASLGRLRRGLLAPMHERVARPDGQAVLIRHRRTCEMTGVTMVPAAGSFETFVSQLHAGGGVIIAGDVPGRSTVSFLGQRICVASGMARLAVEADVPIVPLTLHPGPIQRARVQEPLHPRDFGSDVPALLQAAWDAHAPAVEEWPAALETPLFRWTAADSAVQEDFTRRHEELLAQRGRTLADAAPETGA